jgi:hypothetical protein
MVRFIAVFLLILIPQAADTQSEPRPVFVKALCEGKLSSAVVSAFKQEISTSHRYRLIPSMDDNGRMDVVVSIQMSCTEREKIAAIATVYGKAKCFGPSNCHGAFDVPSLRVDLCDFDAAVDCGRMLFEAFENYLSRPNRTQLLLE